MVLESRKGNPITLGILYSVIAQRIGLPVFGVNLPKNYILAYLDEYKSEETFEKDLGEHILFYINPFRKGAVLNRSEIESFLISQNIEPSIPYFVPSSNQEIIKRLIKNLISSYEKLGYQDKINSYQALYDILNR